MKKKLYASMIVATLPLNINASTGATSGIWPFEGGIINPTVTNLSPLHKCSSSSSQFFASGSPLLPCTLTNPTDANEQPQPDPDAKFLSLPGGDTDSTVMSTLYGGYLFVSPESPVLCTLPENPFLPFNPTDANEQPQTGQDAEFFPFSGGDLYESYFRQVLEDSANQPSAPASAGRGRGKRKSTTKLNERARPEPVDTGRSAGEHYIRHKRNRVTVPDVIQGILILDKLDLQQKERLASLIKNCETADAINILIRHPQVLPSLSAIADPAVSFAVIESIAVYEKQLKGKHPPFNILGLSRVQGRCFSEKLAEIRRIVETDGVVGEV
ncbi:MAG: hypothetical protein K6C34_01790 [Alphaproteobacteria bacterium]|nr:hypothetical protein [Alphaproteobacteria bacterium]